jgi:hypothetical protein
MPCWIRTAAPTMAMPQCGTGYEGGKSLIDFRSTAKIFVSALATGSPENGTSTILFAELWKGNCQGRSMGVETWCETPCRPSYTIALCIGKWTLVDIFCPS